MSRAARLVSTFACWTIACTGNIAREGGPADESGDDEGVTAGTGGGVPSGGRGGVGGSGGSGGTSPPAFVPAPARMRRLTVLEYRNSVRDLLGEPVTLPSVVEPDVVLFGFTSVGAASSDVSRLGVDRYEKASWTLAAEAMGSETRRRAFVGCAPTAATDPCVRTFIERFGRRAFRRPLEKEETDGFLGLVSTMAQAPGNVNLGLEYVVAAFLQSPSFLYRPEVGRAMEGGQRRFDGWEMASRLSFLFWASGPDDALLDAAAAGTLDGVTGVQKESERLLGSPKARDGLLRFFAEWLELGKLAELEKDPTLFPSSAALGLAMKSEAERAIESLAITKKQDLLALLDTRETFLNGALARHYGVSGPAGDAFVPVTLPADSPRAGLLGLGGFLSLLADGTSTSPTLRGKFVREMMLCQHVPPPPIGADTDLDPPVPGKPMTTRQRLDAHRTDPSCAGCHAMMDPIGFGMEHFDAMGAYREKENGLAIDATGELDGVAFDGLKGLAAAVKRAPEIEGCLVRHVYRFATAHEETDGEEGVLLALTDAFRKGGRRFPELVRTLVASEGFRFAGAAQ